jgi:hypothetical protein
MDDPFFAELEQVSGRRWSPSARVKLEKGILEFITQATLVGAKERSGDLSRFREVAKKARLLVKAIRNCSERDQQYFAWAMGFYCEDEDELLEPNFEKMARGLEALTAMEQGLKAEQKWALDGLIWKVADAFEDAGGRASISREGPFARVLMHVHGILPGDLRSSKSPEAFVRRAEMQRDNIRQALDMS